MLATHTSKKQTQRVLIAKIGTQAVSLLVLTLRFIRMVIKEAVAEYQVMSVAVVIELQIMRFPMLTQNQCTFNLSAHDERPGHGRGQIPCILGLCFFRQTYSYYSQKGRRLICIN